LTEENAELSHEIEVQTQRRRQRQDDCKKLQKEINKEHKDFKMREYENENVVNINKELETSIGGTMKFLEELDKDMQKYNASLKNLVEEQAIFVG